MIVEIVKLRKESRDSDLSQIFGTKPLSELKSLSINSTHSDLVRMLKSLLKSLNSVTRNRIFRSKLSYDAYNGTGIYVVDMNIDDFKKNILDTELPGLIHVRDYDVIFTVHSMYSQLKVLNHKKLEILLHKFITEINSHLVGSFVDFLELEVDQYGTYRFYCKIGFDLHYLPICLYTNQVVKAFKEDNDDQRTYKGTISDILKEMSTNIPHFKTR